jgi:hypothetical protein
MQMHWFIMVESGTFDDDVFKADDIQRVAFSYVPEPTYNYINGKYDGITDIQFIPDTEPSLMSLWGYLPFIFTNSYVVDTWKLTSHYEVIKSKPVSKWRFHRFPVFNKYNLLFLIPFYRVTDCIGYSNYHYENASSPQNRPYRKLEFPQLYGREQKALASSSLLPALPEVFQEADSEERS